MQWKLFCRESYRMVFAKREILPWYFSIIFIVFQDYWSWVVVQWGSTQSFRVSLLSPCYIRVSLYTVVKISGSSGNSDGGRTCQVAAEHLHLSTTTACRACALVSRHPPDSKRVPRACLKPLAVLKASLLLTHLINAISSSKISLSYLRPSISISLGSIVPILILHFPRIPASFSAV